jgi:iron(III) transport system permease protein
MTLAAVAVAILAVLPLDLLVVQAVSAGWTRVGQLLFRPLVGTLLLNTALITATATVAASVLGVAVAWCIERTDLPGRRIWGVLAGLPITVPAFVTSYSWVSLTPVVQDYGGALLIVTLAYYPLVYLPVAAVLRGMDPALEESARSLGLGPGRTFLRVVLPHTRPALLGGALVVAVHLLAEFGAFSMLRFRTFTTAIYDEYRLSFDGPGASMLATVLVSLCIVLLLLELQLRGKAHYARIGPGTVRPVHRIKLGRAAPGVVVGLMALIGSALGLPLATLGYWLLRGGSAALQLGPLISAAATSLAFALGAAVLTILLALPVAVLAVRYPGRLATVIERSTYLTYALPGITVALALVVLSVRYLRPIYQTAPPLLAAYAILFLPLALVAVRAALTHSPPAVEEVARSLGCGQWATLTRVTLPLIAPGLGTGAALVFLFTMTELPATLLLAPIGTETLATHVWASVRSLAFGAAAPYAALMIALSALPTYLLTRKLGLLGGAQLG